MESAKPDIDPKDDNILTSYDESFVPWTLYTNIQNSIQFADNKINLLFVIAGIILSIVLGNVENFKEQHWSFKLVFVVILISIIPFMYYSIRTVAAHTKHKPDVKSNKLYFFGEILTLQASQYIAQFKAQPRKVHYDEVLLQIHNLSHIAKKKFENYAKALNILCIMICLLLVLLAIKAFTS